MSAAEHVASLRAPLLVVEDDAPLRQVVVLLMREQGYDVVECGTGAEALRLVEETRPSLVLLDLGLPDMDGVDVAGKLREFSKVPILVLSIRADEESIEAALDRGANDYVTKPFRERELFARLRACLRSAPQASSNVAPITLDTESRSALLGERRVKLTGIECKLLSALLRAQGRVVTHQQLLREVWAGSKAQDAGYLRVYMHHLREKLEADPANPRWLLTEPGLGYRIDWEG
jgi:two-component system KDP operon response regulator KdpE